MAESNLRKAEESKNKKKAKKIILKPLIYSNSDLSSISALGGEKEFVEFASLITRVKDEIDLIYIDPSEKLEGLDKNSIKIKTIFNSQYADYMIVESKQQLRKSHCRDENRGLQKGYQ
jgi:3-dehydroquinate synthase II